MCNVTQGCQLCKWTHTRLLLQSDPLRKHPLEPWGDGQAAEIRQFSPVLE